MVPVDAEFIAAVRDGAAVEFSVAPSVDAQRMRGQLIASQTGPEFYWNQFDAQGRNTGSREVRDDEVNDLVHSLVAPELVPDAVMDSVADDMERMLAAMAAGSPLESIRLASELLMAADSESRVHVARDYFRARLQDSSVDTAIGPVKIIGGTWKEMRRGMVHDGIKAGLVPLVPTILSSGYLVGGREPDTKHRTDYSAFFFIRMDGIKIGDFIVDAGVTVGERPEGSFEYRLSAYSLGHSRITAWQKRIAPEAPRGNEPRTSGAMGDGEPFLDDIMGYQPEDCNIVILAVRDAKTTSAVLDSALDRARSADDIASKVAELQAATGVQRVRVAGELAAMVGGTITAMPENQARGPQGDAQQGASTGNAVAKHSPEQLAKWAQEKCDRESRQAMQAEADRQAEKQISQRSLENMRKTQLWSEFTDGERAEIESYTSVRDRVEEGRSATISAIGRALSNAGLEIEKFSESNDGKSKSIYVRAGDELVRVSDHELPMTAKRQNDREQGLSGRWDREVIVSDWTSSTIGDYVADVLGVAEAGRLGYEIGSRQQGENTSDGDAQSVQANDQSAPVHGGAKLPASGKAY